MMFLLYIVIGNALVIASNVWLIYRLYASCFPNNVNSTYHMRHIPIDDYFEVGVSWRKLHKCAMGSVLEIIMLMLFWPYALFTSIAQHSNLSTVGLFYLSVPKQAELPIKPWYARLHRKYHPEWYI